MKQSIIHITLLVSDYDEAIEYYTHKLGFNLIEDTLLNEQGKRWILVSPPRGNGVALLLAKASNIDQREVIGKQAAGRVFLFLATDDLSRDYETYKKQGIEFIQEPVQHEYGSVAVFRDLYGNLWDLIEQKSEHRNA